MSEEKYHFLIVDDDKDFIERYKRFHQESLLDIDHYKIKWSFCTNFNNAVNTVEKNYYDLIICDVRDGISNVDGGLKVVNKIKERHLCPIIMFSAGGQPKYVRPPFITFVSKVSVQSYKNLLNKIKNLIDYGVVSIRKKMIADITMEIEKSCCDFAWSYLEKNWEKVKQDFTVNKKFDASKLETVVRRRIETKMFHESMINPSLYGYYLFPIKDKKITLGTIIKYTDENGKSAKEEVEKKETKKIGIVLTPHCYLEEHGESKAKVDSFLIVNCFNFTNLNDKQKEFIQESINIYNKDKKKKDNFNKIIRIPIAANCFSPQGRYCFLPCLPGEFFDLFCDLNDLEQLPLYASSESDTQDFKRISYEVLAQVLPPYAEALQSAFVKYYASVGTPNLDIEPEELIKSIKNSLDSMKS